MKKNILLLTLIAFAAYPSFGQKDKTAWKSETRLEQQYEVFKNNLDFWDGKYILTEAEMDEFNTAITDSLALLENEIVDQDNTISTLQNDLYSTNRELETTKSELATSVENQNAIEVFGANIAKSTYTLFMSLFILVLLVALGVVFLLFNKSNKVTVRAKKDYAELKEEFEVHKKNALERYTKLNMELHHTRMGKNKV